MINILKSYSIFRMLALIILFYLTGCYTTHTVYVEPDNLPEDKRYRIESAVLKSGRAVNLGIHEPRFEKEYKGKKNVLLYYDETYSERYIEINNIQMLRVEVIEETVAGTILIVAGGVILAVFIAFILIMSNYSVH